ncbi:MAG: radical SAM protein [Candidatus Parabeggiatoa sp.]|nr:radical SAM protein [Candidatus Parabeggiatoa sp.]
MATFLQKVQLLRGLLTGNAASTSPFFVTLDVTSRCNLQCLGCPYHSESAKGLPTPRNPGMMDMTIDFVKHLCNELKTTKTRSIVIEGSGEPFLNPHIFDMISVIKAAGFQLTLLTNGTLLDRNGIQRLVDAKVDTIKVSLWASSIKEYRLNYPGVNPTKNFKKVLDGLQLFSDIKAEQKSHFPVVWIHNPITPHNFRSINAMVDLAIKMKCNGLSFYPMTNFFRETLNSTFSVDEEQLIYDSIMDAKKRLDTHSMQHNVSNVLIHREIGEKVWEKFPCYITWIHARFRADGTATPCCRCNQVLGNLNLTSFQKFWNRSTIHAFRRQTATREGLIALNSDCRFCPHFLDNARIHQVLKWLSPFQAKPH